MNPIKNAIQEFNQYLSLVSGEPRVIKENINHIVFHGDSISVGELHLIDNKEQIKGRNDLFAWYTVAFLYALFPKLDFRTFEPAETLQPVVERILKTLYYHVSKKNVPEHWKVDFVQIVFGDALKRWREDYTEVDSNAPFICFHRTNTLWDEYEAGDVDPKGREFDQDVFTLDNSLRFFVPLRERRK